MMSFFLSLGLWPRLILLRFLGQLGILGLIGLVSLGPQDSWAQVDYIPPQKAQQLKTMFLQSNSKFQLTELAGKKLICTMYGVRTRMSKEEQVPLYHFSLPSSLLLSPLSLQLRNQGSQPIGLYTLQSSGRGLQGQIDSLSGVIRDQIRRHHSGQWISQLSLLADDNPESAPQDGHILAYSVCSETVIERGTIAGHSPVEL